MAHILKMMNQTFYILGRLKDPFPPARIAAINALAATQQFYTLAETSGRVVPILCPLMSDPEKPVREQAFKVSFNNTFTYQGLRSCVSRVGRVGWLGN